MARRYGGHGRSGGGFGGGPRTVEWVGKAASARGGGEQRAAALEGMVQTIGQSMSLMHDAMMQMQLKMERTDMALRGVTQKLHVQGPFVQNIGRRMDDLERRMDAYVWRDAKQNVFQGAPDTLNGRYNVRDSPNESQNAYREISGRQASFCGQNDRTNVYSAPHYREPYSYVSSNERPISNGVSNETFHDMPNSRKRFIGSSNSRPNTYGPPYRRPRDNTSLNAKPFGTRRSCARGQPEKNYGAQTNRISYRTDRPVHPNMHSGPWNSPDDPEAYKAPLHSPRSSTFRLTSIPESPSFAGLGGNSNQSPARSPPRSMKEDCRMKLDAVPPVRASLSQTNFPNPVVSDSFHERSSSPSVARSSVYSSMDPTSIPNITSSRASSVPKTMTTSTSHTPCRTSCFPPTRPSSFSAASSPHASCASVQSSLFHKKRDAIESPSDHAHESLVADLSTDVPYLDIDHTREDPSSFGNIGSCMLRHYQQANRVRNVQKQMCKAQPAVLEEKVLPPSKPLDIRSVSVSRNVDEKESVESRQCIPIGHSLRNSSGTTTKSFSKPHPTTESPNNVQVTRNESMCPGSVCDQLSKTSKRWSKSKSNSQAKNKTEPQKATTPSVPPFRSVSVPTGKRCVRESSVSPSRSPTARSVSAAGVSKSTPFKNKSCTPKKSPLNEEEDIPPSRCLSGEFMPSLSSVSPAVNSSLVSSDFSRTLFRESNSCPSWSSCTASTQTNELVSRRLNTLGKNLLNAAQEGRTEAVRKLLNAGAFADFTFGSSWTPLHRASANAHGDVVDLLLQRRADPNATIRGYTALHMAAYNDQSGRCVKLLLDAGSDVDKANYFGRTPLHYAAEYGNEAAVRLLVAAGANKMAKDKEGKTPSNIAKSHCIRRLLAPYANKLRITRPPGNK